MASPFKRTKTERRRLRKHSRKSQALAEWLKDRHPEFIETMKKMAETDLRLARSRRKKKRLQNKDVS